MIVFHYKREPARIPGQFVHRPVAEGYLKAKSNKWIKFNPYIDSGADVTLIPLSLGKLLELEINKNKIEEIGGIRGSVPVIYTKVALRIGEEEILTQVAWALIEEVPPLLGRTDIFDSFKVTFEQTKGIITFEEATKKYEAVEGEVVEEEKKEEK